MQARGFCGVESGHSYVCVVCFDMGDTGFSIYFCTESSIYEAMYIFALNLWWEHILLYSGSRGTFYRWNHRKQTSACHIPCLAGSFSSGVFLVCKRNRV